MHTVIFRGIAFISLALLPVAAMLPWYCVPVGIRTSADGGVECQCPTPYAARLLALTCVAVAAARAWGWYRGRSHTERTARELAVFLVALLSFPYCLTVLDTSLAAQSARLFEQHENLTAFNGDYSVDQEFGSRSWRRYIYANSEDQWRVPVFQPLVWGPEMFQLGHLQTVLYALGYTNPFCQFIGPGWFVALVAAMGLLLAAWSADGTIQPRRVVVSIRYVLGFGFACSVAALSPLLIAAFLLAAAREATASGEYELASSYCLEAAAALPILDEDSAFTMQLGLLDWRSGRMDSPHARTCQAEAYERQGQDAVAAQAYRDVMRSVQPGSSVHHEACRGLLRLGIVAFNTGALNRAIELFETVLAQEPCNIKANFALQLAYLRTSKRPELERLVRRIDSIYARYQYPTKMLVVAFSHENAKLAAYLDGDLADSIRHDFRAKHPEVSSKSYRIKHP